MATRIISTFSYNYELSSLGRRLVQWSHVAKIDNEKRTLRPGQIIKYQEYGFRIRRHRRDQRQQLGGYGQWARVVENYDDEYVPTLIARSSEREWAFTNVLRRIDRGTTLDGRFIGTRDIIRTCALGRVYNLLNNKRFIVSKSRTGIAFNVFMLLVVPRPASLLRFKLVNTIIVSNAPP